LLLGELQKRAAASAALRKVAAGMLARGAAQLAAHPIRTGVAALGAGISVHKFRRTMASMDPKAHATMLGMNQ
jgi:hypothetical protein